MAVTITQFRQKLFQLADQALEGETIEFIHKGVIFKVVPQTRKSKLARLTAENIFPPGVDPDSIVDSSDLLKEMEAEWEKDWADL
jgi:antitoxin (DNA-binding transcriptional repressor) of toxin-antitoxin stability system